MVIEHAERFGLAQLHQLRGASGAARERASCILLYASPLSEMARARLKVIIREHRRFQDRVEDLHLRGPGSPRRTPERHAVAALR